MVADVYAIMQCKSYFVQDILVEANVEYTPSSNSDSRDDIKFDYAIGKNPELLSFMITLSLEINSLKTKFKDSRYHLKLTLLSVFDFPPDTNLEEIKAKLEPNGLAMSYSIARGIIGDVTANALHGRYILPTVNFMKVIEQNHKKKEAKRIKRY